MTFNSHDYTDEVKKQAWKYTIQKLRNTYVFNTCIYFAKIAEVFNRKFLYNNIITIVVSGSHYGANSFIRGMLIDFIDRKKKGESIDSIGDTMS